MDLSIAKITPDDWEARGARDYDDGHAVDGHGLPEDSLERERYEFGWHRRRVEHVRARGRQVVQPGLVMETA